MDKVMPRINPIEIRMFVTEEQRDRAKKHAERLGIQITKLAQLALAKELDLLDDQKRARKFGKKEEKEDKKKHNKPKGLGMNEASMPESHSFSKPKGLGLAEIFAPKTKTTISTSKPTITIPTETEPASEPAESDELDQATLIARFLAYVAEAENEEEMAKREEEIVQQVMKEAKSMEEAEEFIKMLDEKLTEMKSDPMFGSSIE